MTRRTDKLKSLARHMSAEIIETPAQQEDRYIPSQQEVDEAIAHAEEMNQNMHVYGTIDAPKTVSAGPPLITGTAQGEIAKLVDVLSDLLDTMTETRVTPSYKARQKAIAVLKPYRGKTRELDAKVYDPLFTRSQILDYTLNRPQQSWSGKPTDIIQTALFAGQEMIMFIDDSSLFKLSYMGFICQGFRSFEEAKQTAPQFARSVITNMLSLIED